MMRLAFLFPIAALVACNPPQLDTDVIVDDVTSDMPDEYDFQGRDGSGDGSVSYGGQTFRQVLIGEMKGYIGGISEDINAGAFPVDGEIEGNLAFYFDFDSSTSGGAPLNVGTEPAALQSTFADVSSGKDLVGKIAGNDPTGQSKDWNTELVGWHADGVDTPESLVRHWFSQIDDQSVAWAAGDFPLGPDGKPVPAVYVTPEGQDLQQLLQKFLLASVNFSQGADDYLDDDLENKGLLSDHSGPVEGKPYTALEHAWDEGFGYFGAARTYGQWSDDEIAAGYRDQDEDGSIDLASEYCWGHSVNAAKRDRGAVVATDFTQQSWEGFAAGRQLLADADGDLTDAELIQLIEHRDRALTAWEGAIAATVVHYLNEALVDAETFSTDDYDFGDQAKHWSELKGFALSFQFNPHSSLSDADFVLLHDLIGQAPVLPTASVTAQEAYVADLLEARNLVGNAYGFHQANLGDEHGQDGW